MFDKIGQFVNHYWGLGHKLNTVTLRRVWYEKNERTLREAFRLHPNWPLRGLFWLSRDLFDDRSGFRDHTDPDAQAIARVRNRIEHGFLAVHEFDALYKTVGLGLPEDHPLQPDKNLYAISRRALVINPATARSARSAVSTADPTDQGVTVVSAVRTVRGRPER